MSVQKKQRLETPEIPATGESKSIGIERELGYQTADYWRGRLKAGHFYKFSDGRFVWVHQPNYISIDHCDVPDPSFYMTADIFFDHMDEDMGMMEVGEFTKPGPYEKPVVGQEIALYEAGWIFDTIKGVRVPPSKPEEMASVWIIDLGYSAKPNPAPSERRSFASIYEWVKIDRSIATEVVQYNTARNPELADDTEKSCLKEKCSITAPAHRRAVASQQYHHKHLTYRFYGWTEGSYENETPARTLEREKNERWLRLHHEKMVCILSVSIAKVSGGTLDLNRRTMLINAILRWVDQGWHVLLFVPVVNIKMYTECAKLTTRFGDFVNVVPYSISEGTCNKRMVVGESRNAIMKFCWAFKDIFSSVLVSDERVEELALPRPNKKDGLKEPDDVRRLRINHGFMVADLIKKYVSANESTSELEDEFKTGQETMQNQWLQFTNDNARWKTPLRIYDPTLPQLSLWHCLEERRSNGRRISLVGLPTVFRSNMQKTDSSFFLANHTDGLYNSFYKAYTTKGEQKFRYIGGDYTPIMENSKTMITQCVIMKIGGMDGWNNNLLYPYTTIGEDNYFSYEWDKNIGNAIQCNMVTILRKFKKAAVSITRTPDTVNNYTECAVNELVHVMKSGTYKVKNKKVKIKWVTGYDPVDLETECYKWMAFIFSQVENAFHKKQMESNSRASLPPKIAQISRRLAKYFMALFKKPTPPVNWKTPEKQAILRNMISVYDSQFNEPIYVKEGSIIRLKNMDEEGTMNYMDILNKYGDQPVQIGGAVAAAPAGESKHDLLDVLRIRF